MRIRFEELSDTKRAGGVECATRGLVAALAKEGVEVVRSSEFDAATVSSRPDCVHMHGLWSPALVQRVRSWRRQQIPFLVSIHGMLEPWALAHKRWKKRMAWTLYQKSLLESAGCLHATSKREASNLRNLRIKCPVAVIPWGIAESGCTTLAAITQTRTVLFVGRLYPVKGLPNLLEAWSRLRPNGWRLKLVGPDEADHRSDLERQILQLGLAAQVEFTGPLQGGDLVEAYRTASLLVLPSFTENFGMVVGEALAHGLPVITTKGTPWEELVTHRCGWWVDIGVEPLAAALREAMSLFDEQRREMGLRGRALIEAKYTWPPIARQMIEVYQWVLGRGPLPACVQLADR